MKLVRALSFLAAAAPLALMALGSSSLVACTGAKAGGKGDPLVASATASEPQIAEEWRAKCGNCHRRVEPGSRTRATLDDAFKRHRTRTRLSEEQWGEMEDFLSSTPTTATSAAAAPGAHKP